MNVDTIWQIVRYILIAVGGFFVAKGQVDEGTVEQIIAAIGTLFVAVWGIWARASGSGTAS
jgi:hypothetical protein